MAKNRYLNTHFWDDVWVVELDQIEKLMFLYLLTNPLTTIAGVYEISLRRIALDTGLDKDMILKILARFEDAGKVFYQDGWVAIVNFTKHQAINPKIQKGIDKTLSGCPDWVSDRLSKPMDRLSKPLNNLNLNLNTNTNINAGDDLDFLGETIEGIKKKLNITFTLPNEPLWKQSISWAFMNKFSVSDYLDCFDYLSNQKWRNSAVKPNHVTENLPTFRKSSEKTVKADGFTH